DPAALRPPVPPAAAVDLPRGGDSPVGREEGARQRAPEPPRARLRVRRFRRVLRARDPERRRADGDARLHLHERDALLSRAEAVRAPGAERAAAVAGTRRLRRDPETDPRLERRVLDGRRGLLAGDAAGDALSRRG